MVICSGPSAQERSIFFSPGRTMMHPGPHPLALGPAIVLQIVPDGAA